MISCDSCMCCIEDVTVSLPVHVVQHFTGQRKMVLYTIQQSYPRQLKR